MRYGSFSPNHFPTMNWMPCKHVAFLAGARCVTRSTPLFPICQQIIWFKHIKLYNSADYSHLTYQHTNIHRLHRFSREPQPTFHCVAKPNTPNTIIVNPSTKRHHNKTSKTCNFHISSLSSLCAEHEHTKIPKSRYIVGTVAIVSLNHSMTFKFKYAKDF